MLFRLDERYQECHRDAEDLHRHCLARFAEGNRKYSRNAIEKSLLGLKYNGPIRREKTPQEKLAISEQQLADNEKRIRTLQREIAELAKPHADATNQLAIIKAEPWSARLMRLADLRNLERSAAGLAAHISLLKSQLEAASRAAMGSRTATAEYQEQIADAERRSEVKAKRSQEVQEREERKAAKLEANRAIAARALARDRDVANSAKRQISAGPDCPYCGCLLPEERHLDHIFPISLGGLSISKNMVWV